VASPAVRSKHLLGKMACNFNPRALVPCQAHVVACCYSWNQITPERNQPCKRKHGFSAC